MELTKEQIEFLKHHKIALKDTFDASSFSSTAVYQQRMKDDGKIVAFGVTPCKNGHQLRTRSGHCVQCDPKKITFIKRHVSHGIVYVSGSFRGKLIKVGFTANSVSRKESINRTKYGGFDDWETLCSVECSGAGKVENKIITILEKYRYRKTYQHDGKDQEAYELFSCAYETVMNAVKTALVSNGYELNIIKERKFVLSKYHFPNRILVKKQ